MLCWALTTHGRPLGSTARRRPPPGVGAQAVPGQRQMPNPPVAGLAPATHTAPLAPTPTSVPAPACSVHPGAGAGAAAAAASTRAAARSPPGGRTPPPRRGRVDEVGRALTDRSLDQLTAVGPADSRGWLAFDQCR